MSLYPVQIQADNEDAKRALHNHQSLKGTSMTTIRMERNGRVYYFKAENKSDGEILILALKTTYPAAVVDFL